MTTHHLFPKLCVAASVSLLAACAAPHWTKIDQQAFTIRAACERQHINGLIPTALATEQCANGSIHQLYAEAHYPQMDVLDQYLARREAIANAVDRQTLAPADAHVKLAEAETEQVTALETHHLDPIVFGTAPYRVKPVCEHLGFVHTLCN